MKHLSMKLAAGVAALAIASVALVACASQPAADDGAADAAAPAAGIDFDSMTTLGDALAIASDTSRTAQWNDTYYVTAFPAGNAYVRAVALIEPDTEEKLFSIDYSEDYEQQELDILSPLELVSAEDISGDMVPQADLDALAGKTGQDLMDEGFEFVSYFFYGGEETGVTLSKGMFEYSVTFDGTVSDTDAESDWDGEHVKDLVVKSAEVSGASNAATDPDAVA